MSREGGREQREREREKERGRKGEVYPTVLVVTEVSAQLFTHTEGKTLRIHTGESIFLHLPEMLSDSVEWVYSNNKFRGEGESLLLALSCGGAA